MSLGELYSRGRHCSIRKNHFLSLMRTYSLRRRRLDRTAVVSRAALAKMSVDGTLKSTAEAGCFFLSCINSFSPGVLTGTDR